MNGLQKFYRKHQATIAFVVLGLIIAVVFWRQEHERDQRTLQLCQSSITDAEVLVFVSAQNPNSQPADPQILALFRRLKKLTLPEICQPRYEELLKAAQSDIRRLMTVPGK